MWLNREKLAEEIALDPERTRIQENRTHWANRLSKMSGEAYRDGDCTRASELIMKALALDPWQAERFGICAKAIQVKAANAGQETAARLSLRAQTQCRLAAAGITHGDPELVKANAWNQIVGAVKEGKVQETSPEIPTVDLADITQPEIQQESELEL
jgi:hypothetical protein